MEALHRVSEYCPWPQYLVPCPGNQSQFIAPFALPEPIKPMIFTGAPIPPSSNNTYPTNSYTGKRMKSKELVQFERDFATWGLTKSSEFRSARALMQSILKPGKMIRIDVHFYFKREKILCKDGRPKKHDTSNLLKCLHDQLAQFLTVDDCWFFDGSFHKRIAKPGELERCDMSIEVIDALWMMPIVS